MSRKLSKRIAPEVQRLHSEGKTVVAWAKEHGFNVRAVRAVIHGHNKGQYGNAFRIAHALGMKDPNDAER